MYKTYQYIFKIFLSHLLKIHLTIKGSTLRRNLTETRFSLNQISKKEIISKIDSKYSKRLTLNQYELLTNQTKKLRCVWMCAECANTQTFCCQISENDACSIDRPFLN